MNQLFIDKLHECVTDNNKSLLEAVENLYMACEGKAQLEGRLGKALGAAGLCGAMAGCGQVRDAYYDYQKGLEQDRKTEQTATTVANRSYEGSILKNHGYKFVDVSEHPGLYSESFNSMDLNDLDSKPYVQVGWYVSPDGSKYYSTVTGDVYKMPEGQTFDDATSSNRGDHLGNGVLATGDVKDGELNKCSLSMYAKYGEDPNCPGGKYYLLSPAELKMRGAEK